MDWNWSKQMLKLTRPQPNQIGPVLFSSVDSKRPVLTSLLVVFLSLTKLYYIVNKINDIYMLRTVAHSGVPTRPKEKEKE
jgi:hypothetical protein